jgi:hypothetical protein
VIVFRVADPLPRAYAVGRARVADAAAALRQLVAEDFEPEREIVLPAGPVLQSPALASTVRLLEARPDRVRIDADLSAPGYVVTVDAWDPDWHATLDGRPAPLLRANVAFRAVAVPAGRHTIEEVYRPSGLRAGLSISALALMGWIVLAWASGRTAQAPRAPSPVDVLRPV